MASIVSGAETNLVYTDGDGVTSIRLVKVLSIEKCDNRQTVVRCYDLHRDAPRCFRLARIESVNPFGVLVIG